MIDQGVYSLSSMVKADPKYLNVLIPSTVNQTDPNVAMNAMHHYELSSVPMPSVPDVETRFSHQEIEARFFSPHQPNRRCLVYHGMGSGKTCLLTLLYERFRLTQEGKYPRKKALIITTNWNLIKQMKTQIAKTCFPDYAAQLKPGASDDQLVYILRDHYFFTTLQTFAMSISTMSDDDIRDKYGNRDIFIDEAHTIRSTNINKNSTTSVYGLYDRFLHVAGEDTRQFLLTGTPIWDTVIDAVMLYNLILPEVDQFNVSMFIKDYFKKDNTMHENKNVEFRAKIRGLTSYLKTRLNTTILHMGESGGGYSKYYPVVALPMQKFQAKIVKKVHKEEKMGIIKNSRDASNCVFPDGSTGRDGFDRNVKRTITTKPLRKGGIRRNKTNTRDIVSFEYKSDNTRREFRDHLKKYSAKFAYIISQLVANPREVATYFSSHVTSTGGLINLGLVLQLHGFTWAKKPRDIESPGQRRFVLFSSLPGTTNDPTDIQAMLGIINKPENKYGDYCSLILISEAASTGLNVKNVRAFYHTPHWNVSLTNQAAGRAERADAHDAFDRDDEKYIHEYMLAAVYPPNDITYNNLTAPDVHVFSTAEKKDRQNAELLRAMIESAWDCALFYSRNVERNTLAMDKSPECFYKSCNYTCDNYDPALIDKSNRKPWVYKTDPTKMVNSNYLLFYSHPDITRTKDNIKSLFSNYFSLHIDQVSELIGMDTSLEGVDRHILLTAMHQLIDHNEIVYNQFGIATYMREDNNIYYLTSHKTFPTDVIDTTMAMYPAVVDILSLEMAILIDSFDTDRNLVKRLFDMRELSSWTLSDFEDLRYPTIVLMADFIVTQAPTDHDAHTQFARVFHEHFKAWNLPNGTSTWVHDFYSAMPYNNRSMPPKTQFTRRNRILVYRPETNTWTSVRDPEKKAIKELFSDTEDVIKRKVTSRAATGEWKFPESNVYGTFSAGKFKIRRRVHGKKTGAGSVCTEAGTQPQALILIMTDMKFYPSRNWVRGTGNSTVRKSYNVAQLLVDALPPDTIKPELKKFLDSAHSRYKPTTDDNNYVTDIINNISDDQAKTLLIARNMKKSPLCQMIQLYLKEKNLIDDSTQ